MRLHFFQFFLLIYLSFASTIFSILRIKILFGKFLLMLLLEPFKYFEHDNQSYKLLCQQSNNLYKKNKELIHQNKELKKTIMLLKKEKYYWIPLIITCSFIGFASGDGFSDKNNSTRNSPAISDIL